MWLFATTRALASGVIAVAHTRELTMPLSSLCPALCSEGGSRRAGSRHGRGRAVAPARRAVGQDVGRGDEFARAGRHEANLRLSRVRQTENAAPCGCRPCRMGGCSD